MPEIRQNIITKDWVIFATERAKRPQDFSKPTCKRVEDLPSYSEKCPFCVGNEDDGTIEAFRLSDDQGWRVRVTSNKYPALALEGERTRYINGMYRSLNGVGFHDVIIEHPLHNVTIAILPVEDVANILRAYRQRYMEVRKDPRIEAIVIFKNHGQGAGGSLEHPHSQLAGIPIVPSQFRMRIDEAIRYFDDMGRCIFCHTLEEELTYGERIIVSTEMFVAFIPYAALSPFHIWIFPRRHASSYDDITDPEIMDLAYVLKTVLAKVYFGIGNPDYNLTIRSIPTGERYTEYFHWYIAIIPYVSKTAGFEVGSGMYINSALPENSAKFLRDQLVEGI